MIRVGDYIVVDDFGYKCICKLISVGMENRDIRTVSVKILDPKLFKEAFRITIDMKNIEILTEDQIRIVKLLYE